MQALSNLMAETEVLLIPIVIDKDSLKELGADLTHVYHLAMQIGLRKTLSLSYKNIANIITLPMLFLKRGAVRRPSL